MKWSPLYWLFAAIICLDKKCHDQLILWKSCHVCRPENFTSEFCATHIGKIRIPNCRVDLLMNNAGTGRPNTSWEHLDAWQTTLGVNLWGVIHGVHTFAPTMVSQGSPGAIINTGSKQG